MNICDHRVNFMGLERILSSLIIRSMRWRSIFPYPLCFTSRIENPFEASLFEIGIRKFLHSLDGKR